MTAAAYLYSPEPQLAWSASSGDDRRFYRLLGGTLLLLAVLGVGLPFVQLPEELREAAVKPPPTLTQVVIEAKQLPEPKLEKPQPLPEPPTPKDPPKPKPRPKVVEQVKPTPKIIESARDKAAKSGLMQFQDDLQSMRDSLDMSKMQGAHLTQGAAKARQLDRAVISSQAQTTSGGINTAALSRDVGGVALSGRETTRVESKLASASGTSPRPGDPANNASGRSEEEIRKTMDRNQGAIFSIYNRALRSNPALQGKLVIKMVIEPSGKLSAVTLISSELKDAALEQKLLARIRLVQFGVQNVIRTTLNYTFDFLPY